VSARLAAAPTPSAARSVRPARPEVPAARRHAFSVSAALLAALGVVLLAGGPVGATLPPPAVAPATVVPASVTPAPVTPGTVVAGGGVPGAVDAPVPAPATTAAQPGAATALPATITAATWLVADAGTGEILAAKGPRTRDLPASTMKILTALVVLPALPPDQLVTVGKDAAEVDGTKVGLVPGQSYSVRDLATAMLIASGNDATLALVDAVGGRAAVLGRMNALAGLLGGTDTVAVDPTGLDAPGQLTSARDLAIFGRAALAEPAVSRYLTIPRASLPTRDGGHFEIQNHNLLLGTYEGTVGVKNGYTVAADATYVGAARRAGRTLIVALLRTAPNYATDARALLDWGFANDGLVAAAGTLPAATMPVHPDVGLVGSAGTLDPAGSAAEGREPATAARMRSGQGAAGDAGIGWVTWTALVLTLLASALTAFLHGHPPPRRRPPAARPRRARHLASPRETRQRPAAHASARAHPPHARRRPAAGQPMPRQRPPAETNGRRREPGTRA